MILRNVGGSNFDKKSVVMEAYVREIKTKRQYCRHLLYTFYVKSNQQLIKVWNIKQITRIYWNGFHFLCYWSEADLLGGAQWRSLPQFFATTFFFAITLQAGSVSISLGSSKSQVSLLKSVLKSKKLIGYEILWSLCNM